MPPVIIYINFLAYVASESPFLRCEHLSSKHCFLLMIERLLAKKDMQIIVESVFLTVKIFMYVRYERKNLKKTYKESSWSKTSALMYKSSNSIPGICIS
jgi:hypothetical protein